MTRPSNAAKGWVRALAFALGGACLAASILAQGGRFSPWLDLLTHFAPIWMLGAVGTTLLGWVAASGAARRRLVVLGVLGVVAAGGLLAPELTRSIRPSVQPGSLAHVRLVQFNAWEQNADPLAVANWIAGQQPDLVTIEEITPRLRQALIGRGFQYTRGMLDTAIFSQGLTLRPAFQIPARDWPLLPGFARATFVSPNGRGTFTVVSVHLTWPILADHWGQPLAFATLLERQPRDRLIVAGDFNLTSWSFALAKLGDRLGLVRRDRAIFSWPAARRLGGTLVDLPAVLPIDHVYAGSAWRTIGVRRGPHLGSDHYPIVVDLALAP